MSITLARDFMDARAKETAAMQAHEQASIVAHDAEEEMERQGNRVVELGKQLEIDPENGYTGFEQGFKFGHETKLQSIIWQPSSQQLSELMLACSPSDKETAERWRALIQKFQRDAILTPELRNAQIESTTKLLYASGYIKELRVIGYAVQSKVVQRDVVTFMVDACIGDGAAYRSARSCAENMVGGAKFITLYGEPNGDQP